MEGDYSGDSYVVNITQPSDTFPMIQIIRRRRRRRRGTVAQEADLGLLGETSNYQSEAGLNELACAIGRRILDDSEIIRAFRG